MPIKTENKSRYPTNWKQIRADILKRANNRCEFCGVENHSIVRRKRKNMQPDGCWYKDIKIVLTIAHMDNMPENCDYSNLRALCQKCHINYDAKFHAANAKRTRDKKQGQLTLQFET